MSKVQKFGILTKSGKSYKLNFCAKIQWYSWIKDSKNQISELLGQKSRIKYRRDRIGFFSFNFLKGVFNSNVKRYKKATCANNLCWKSNKSQDLFITHKSQRKFHGKFQNILWYIQTPQALIVYSMYKRQWNSTQKNPEIVEILRNVSFDASKMTLTQSL